MIVYIESCGIGCPFIKDFWQDSYIYYTCNLYKGLENSPKVNAFVYGWEDYKDKDFPENCPLLEEDYVVRIKK